MHISAGLMPGHVLQRGPRGGTAAISGTADASGPVTVTALSAGRPLRGWSRRPCGRATRGRFKAVIRGLPTGGPYVLEVRCGEEVAVIAEVYVGDLWLMAGQSNMQGVGNCSDAPRPHPLVRSFTMGQRWELAREPLHHLPESPHRIHHMGAPQTPPAARRAKREALKGVGVGVHFGIEMLRRTGVPQGLIATAHGGTSMQQWDPVRKKEGGDSLYGSMRSSLDLVGQPLAGVLWYQGEDDGASGQGPLYSQRMQNLIGSIRADQRQPRLPVIIVQIGRYVTPPGGEWEWNVVQEQQRRLPQLIDRLAVVPSVDLELDDVIHISAASYPLLARRMARQADRLVHGADETATPVPISCRTIPNYRYGPAIEIRFDQVTGSLRSAGRPLGFSMVDALHRPVEIIYKTLLEKNRVILELTTADRQDLRVMYGWGRNAACTITDDAQAGLPVLGPVRVEDYGPFSAWFHTWKVSGILAGERIARLPRPNARSLGRLVLRTWGPPPVGDPHSQNPFQNFINMHDSWQGKSGHTLFSSDVHCFETMDLELRVGYDGPIRIWIDQKEVLRDLAGTNPATPDAHHVPLTLRRGRHRIIVMMALNQGRAWGFFLRFARRDLPPLTGDGGSVALPIAAC